MYYNAFYHLVLAFVLTIIFLSKQEFEVKDPLPFLHYRQPKLDPTLQQSLSPFANSSRTYPLPHISKQKSINSPFCKIQQFGYTDQQAANFFPLRPFPNCINKNIFSAKHEHFELTCEGKLALGTTLADEELGNVEFPRNFSDPIQNFTLGQTEFFFAQCEDYVAAYYKMKESKTAKSRALKTQQRISQKLGNGFNPLAVHIIMFDSLSRLSFFRNFPTTVQFLNEAPRNLSLFDFSAGVHGYDTQPNLIPIFFGYSASEQWEKIRDLSIFSEQDRDSFLQIQQKAVWNYFKKMGFVTMFGYDTVVDLFSFTVGRKVSADHVSSNFFHAAKKFTGYEDGSQYVKCIGNETSDYYLLKYFQHFTESYKGMNKFSYVHMSQGHEDTGQVIRTVDKNLRKVVNAVVDGYVEQQQDFVIILAGDHGKHSREWDWSYEGLLENRLPLFLILTSNSFQSKIESYADANTERLISRLDLYVTLKHLAVSPYGKLSKESCLYKTWRQEVRFDARSLFIEEIPDRTCIQMGIIQYLCPCEEFFMRENWSENHFLSIQEHALAYQRELIALNRDIECKNLDKGLILKVFERKVREDEFISRVYEIHSTIVGIKDSLVIVFAYVTGLSEMQKSGERKYFMVNLGDFVAAVKILNFTKADYLTSCSETFICYC